MTTDTMVRTKGTKIQREPFDYTKWQENLMEDMSITEINSRATEYRKQKIL